MRFIEFSEYLEKLEKLSSRNEITVLLSELFKKLDNEEIKQAIYLALGRLLPKYISLEFNVSSKLFLRALEGLYADIFKMDNSKDAVKKYYSEFGDIGETAVKVLEDKNIKGENLSINEVYKELRKIAELEGKGSQGEKIEKIQALLQKCSSNEAKFIARMVIGKLRLGMSEKTILDALSWFKVGDKSLRPEIERAFGVRSDIGYISKMVKELSKKELIKKLQTLKIKPGIPVASKLVEREKSVEAVFERMGICLVQPKLDGLRAQIHYKKEGMEKSFQKVQIFSRNMENMTHMFPDLIKYIKENVSPDTNSFVIDSEVIAFNPETGMLLEFQKTIQRKRKHDVKEKVDDIPIKAMAFDLIELDGSDVSQEKIEDRINELEKLVAEFEKSSKIDYRLIEMLDSTKVEDEENLNIYFEDRVGEGLEGVIVKDFGTPYDPGTRNYDWIKLKASIKNDMIDEVDGVVLGYYHGKGIRSKFGIGALLVGIYNEDKNQFETVAKVGTGITDDEFVTIKKDLMRITLKKQPKNYVIDSRLEPNVFVEPEVVVVVEADEITRSKMHTAAQDQEKKGLSMRFPRLKVWNRKDKGPMQTTSPEELEKMFDLK